MRPYRVMGTSEVKMKKPKWVVKKEQSKKADAAATVAAAVAAAAVRACV